MERFITNKSLSPDALARKKWAFRADHAASDSSAVPRAGEQEELSFAVPSRAVLAILCCPEHLWQTGASPLLFTSSLCCLWSCAVGGPERLDQRPADG